MSPFFIMAAWTCLHFYQFLNYPFFLGLYVLCFAIFQTRVDGRGGAGGGPRRHLLHNTALLERGFGDHVEGREKCFLFFLFLFSPLGYGGFVRHGVEEEGFAASGWKWLGGVYRDVYS